LGLSFTDLAMASFAARDRVSSDMVVIVLVVRD
jgi:hypothetical protein